MKSPINIYLKTELILSGYSCPDKAEFYLFFIFLTDQKVLLDSDICFINSELSYFFCQIHSGTTTLPGLKILLTFHLNGSHRYHIQ